MKELLLKLKEEGLDAYQALRKVLEDLLVPMHPTRYEAVCRSLVSGPKVVAVLEVDGRELDRVAVARAPSVEEAEETARHLNALLAEGRGQKVLLYPYRGKELDALLAEISEVLDYDLEDYLGHPFRAMIGVAWK